MRYCMKFYLKGHQNYHKSKSKVPKKCPFIKWIQKCESLTFDISGAHWQKVSCSISFESSHQWYLYLKWAKGWQSLCKDHALGKNLILVHKTRFGPIFNLANVHDFTWHLHKDLPKTKSKIFLNCVFTKEVYKFIRYQTSKLCLNALYW